MSQLYHNRLSASKIRTAVKCVASDIIDRIDGDEIKDGDKLRQIALELYFQADQDTSHTDTEQLGANFTCLQYWHEIIPDNEKDGVDDDIAAIIVSFDRLLSKQVKDMLKSRKRG